VCLNWHILKANKRLNECFKLRELNNRNTELLMKDHCNNRECKELLKIIEITWNSNYMLGDPK